LKPKDWRQQRAIQILGIERFTEVEQKARVVTRQFNTGAPDLVGSMVNARSQ
jgi:hypothetical protein